MTNEPIATQPPTAANSRQVLRDKLDEEIAGQSERMDALARQLITLELAIPGLYAAVLKLLSGDKATLLAGPALYGAFICWLLALICTLISLFPREYRVDRRKLSGDGRASDDAALDIESYFRRPARYKRRWLVIACLLFVAGIAAALLDSLGGPAA